MKDILYSVVKACDERATLSVRHEAFAELVCRFQDMAFACAYALLGDAYLAEDVAQDAFVLAWQRLNQLREPKAFPGWLKRIVLSQCSRLTRRKHLQIVPLEIGDNSSSSDPGPQVLAEKHELLNKVLRAIRALPDNERLVTTLFYVDGYTQTDIGEFLEVPVSTVNKRLYTARQRLKEKVGVFEGKFKTQRPSRDRSFSDRVKANLRFLVHADWTPIKTMAYAREHDVLGNDLWWRQRQDFDADSYVRRQYVVEDTEGQLVAFGSIEQTCFLPKYRLVMVADPDRLNADVGDLLWRRLSKDLKEANAVTVHCREYVSQTHLLEFLRKHGFKETDRVLDLRLEVAEGLTILSQSAPAEITISTLAEERRRNPGCVKQLYDLTTRLRDDDQTRAPFAAPAYNEREALLWLEMPYVIPDAYFIARHGDVYVGVSDVSLFQALPGGLTQGFTGVLREYRRQGIATTLLRSAINYASSNNYKPIQSFVRSDQTAMLSLLEKLEFQVASGNFTLEKCLRTVVEVDSKIYDEYAGHYRDEGRPDLDMIVRNESGRLTLEAAGQKVELFPTSETEFFVKWFYGDATFVRGEQGKVDLLRFVSPEHKTRKALVQNAKRIS
ncbi:MAG TPA: GNAT family N-acetyltransferase [Pyrinomonadaceae bacterium]|nr:GNAT family N-acetyltransferase [Pyrinomonadaceae bacterium]